MPKAEGLLAKGQGIDAATLRARREAQEMMFEAKRMMAEAQAGKAASASAHAACQAAPIPPSPPAASPQAKRQSTNILTKQYPK